MSKKELKKIHLITKKINKMAQKKLLLDGKTLIDDDQLEDIKKLYELAIKYNNKIDRSYKEMQKENLKMLR